jgi:hypothetical protein
MTLLELFCDVDDFCQQYELLWEQAQLSALSSKRVRKPQLSMSEMMTIVIHFHQIRYRDFKTYYTRHVAVYLRQEFPGLVSYNRFVELMSHTVIPLMLYLNSRRGACTGISFVDSTPLKVCDNHRIHAHKVFAGVAQRGKTSMGWFFGFKLHLVINERGELLAFQLTPGNVDDREPVPVLCQNLFGKLFADKGYISQKLFDMLLAQQVQLITKLRKNMKNRLMSLADALLLRKRALIETVNDQLKNISHIEHSRHRSVNNFVVNLFAGLIAYTLQPKKPSLHLDRVTLPTIVA